MGKPISRTCADAFMEKETYSFFPGFCFSLNTDTNFFFFFFSLIWTCLSGKKRGGRILLGLSCLSMPKWCHVVPHTTSFLQRQTCIKFYILVTSHVHAGQESVPEREVSGGELGTHILWRSAVWNICMQKDVGGEKGIPSQLTVPAACRRSSAGR